MANRKKEVYKPKPMTEGKRNIKLTIMYPDRMPD